MLGRRMMLSTHAVHAALPAPIPAMPAMAVSVSINKGCARRMMHSHSIRYTTRPSQTLRAPAAATAVELDSPYAAAEAASADQSYPQLEDGGDDILPTKFTKYNTRAWHLFDARGQIVGRMAGRIATLLQGKHKPSYTPWLDNGDTVVVLNARHLVFTGDKWKKKLYRYHTGYIGGLKEIPAERWRETNSDRILRHAVAGMIKKNKLKVPRMARLKIYPGLIHPHSAQFPEDPIGQVPALKAQRDAEIAELKAKGEYEQNAYKLSAAGPNSAPHTAYQAAQEKAKLDAVRKRNERRRAGRSGADSSNVLAGTDDGTLPLNADIKAAIIKDREQRKGKPYVVHC
jgi:large subunit ribosomal protein L13